MRRRRWCRNRRGRNRVCWRSASPWRLGHQYWGRILNESGLEPVYGDAVLSSADLHSEVLVMFPDDLVWAIVRCLKWGLFELPAYENELCLGQVLRHVRPRTTVVTGGDGTQVTDPFT